MTKIQKCQIIKVLDKQNRADFDALESLTPDTIDRTKTREQRFQEWRDYLRSLRRI